MSGIERFGCQLHEDHSCWPGDIDDFDSPHSISCKFVRDEQRTCSAILGLLSTFENPGGRLFLVRQVLCKSEVAMCKSVFCTKFLESSMCARRELTELRPVSSANFNNLVDLDVSGCMNLEILRDMPDLQSLNASGVRTNRVQQMTSFTKLTHLNLSHKSPKNAILDRTIEILTTFLVGLQVLNMDGAHLLTDSGVMSCTNLRSLRVLNISRSRVTALGVNALSLLTSLQILECKKCEFLSRAMCSGQMRSILQL